MERWVGISDYNTVTTLSQSVWHCLLGRLTRSACRLFARPLRRLLCYLCAHVPNDKPAAAALCGARARELTFRRGSRLVRVRSCNTPRPRLPPRLRAALERSRTHAKLQAQVERCKEVLREAQATLQVSSVVCVCGPTYVRIYSCEHATADDSLAFSLSSLSGTPRRATSTDARAACVPPRSVCARSSAS